MKPLQNFFPAVILLIVFILHSCSSEEKGDNNSADIDTTVSEINVYTIEQIYNELGKPKFPQNWDENFLESGSSYEGINLSADEFNKIEFFDFDYTGDDISFLWKFETADWKLICVKESFFDENRYYLFTLNEYYNLNDELYFAGDMSVKNENEFGGTSTGIEFKTAKIDYKSGTLQIETDNGTFTINERGNFEKPIGGIDPVSLNIFENRFKSYNRFPLNIDSAFISDVSQNNYTQLNAGHVKTLYTNGKELENLYGKWSVKSFIDIDSVKLTGTYEEFLQKDNLGSIVSSEAFAIYKLNFKDDISGLLWAISDATYEACPYSSGTYIYISFVKSGKILCSAMIAEISSGSDAPYWAETNIEAVLYDNTELDITRIQRMGGETDEIEETENNYSYLYENGELKELN